MTDESNENYGLSEERLEAFKSIFRSWDTLHINAIPVGKLDALCYQLGEQFDKEELQAAAQSLKDEKTNMIHFDRFMLWWLSE